MLSGPTSSDVDSDPIARHPGGNLPGYLGDGRSFSTTLCKPVQHLSLDLEQLFFSCKAPPQLFDNQFD